MNGLFSRKIVLTAGVLPLAAAAVARSERPNIVVIVADDLLSSEISCYGGRNLETTHIDRICREGVRFSNLYASMPMSVPIRASMYTGLYPAHHGSWLNHKDTFLGTRTVCDYMEEAGYRVARTGKNHPVNPDVYRFEEIPGFTVNCVSRRAPYDTAGIREFVSRDDPRPFLLFVCSIHPHAPWTWGDPGEFDPAKLVMPGNCIDDPRMREIYTHYLAEVRALDDEVGAVLEVLETTGRSDDTLVLFLGEQGPQLPGGKWTCWYPGVHSAMVARYPGRIAAGSRSDAIVQYEDLLPTFLDLAGAEPRGEPDGRSFKKALFGERKRIRRYAYAMQNNCTAGDAYPVRCIRDERYALIWNLLSDRPFYKTFMDLDKPANRKGWWPVWVEAAQRDTLARRLVDRYLDRPEYEFYDLQQDPWELENLIGDPKHRARIGRMKRELERWMAQQGDSGIGMDVPFTNRPRK